MRNLIVEAGKYDNVKKILGEKSVADPKNTVLDICRELNGEIGFRISR